ncbi:low-density lipoprotein receptor [Plakobranchus ocellatus]|uniref:Low-density lipoprotein receptor n=1 Tax=Plakobranchus ocellatus TaxID=259542 RepID=A0AAV4B5W1_9GAST|nr:low-density lipoprotein receptor [Plakobranchus ocellatus]
MPSFESPAAEQVGEFPPLCHLHEVTCGDGSCVPMDQACDDLVQCPHAEDEHGCGAAEQAGEFPPLCHLHEFPCGDGSCIPMHQVCDGLVQCPHAEDEHGCGVELTCAVSDFRCDDLSGCVQSDHRCDGQPDCKDGSDEAKCGNIQCEKHEFLCSDRSACVSGNDVCDGHMDCLDGSDEVDNCHVHCLALGCSINSRCAFSSAGDLECVCRKDYQQRPGLSQLQCDDVNECALPDHQRVCGHQCYNTPGSYLCFCDSGYKLSADRKSCVVVGPEAELVYATSHQIVSFAMKSKESSILLDDLKGVQGLAVDSGGRRIFWTEVKSPHQTAVYVADLDQPKATRQRVAAFGLKTPQGLTFDPNESNLFIADSDLPAILACNVQSRLSFPTSRSSSNSWSHFLSNSMSDILNYMSSTPSLLQQEFVCVTVFNGSALQRPTYIALDHKNGFLYWIDLGPSPQIMYGRADGLFVETSKRSPKPSPSRKTQSLLSNRLLEPISLSLDLPTQRLFWFDSVLKLLECVGLDGQGRRIIKGTDLGEPFALVVFENQALLADHAESSIVAVQKFTGDNRTTLLPKVGDVTAMAVYHASLDKSRGTAETRNLKADTRNYRLYFF